MPDKLLSKKQVAEILGITTRTVDAWEKRGLLPVPTRIGDSHNLGGTRGYKRWSQNEITATLADFNTKD